jgi:dihydrofolate reductase
MRRIIVLSFITLDGVMQAPGAPEEDASGSLKYGGWQAPYFDDFMAEVMAKQLGHPFDLLLGRKTYDVFASYWPHQDEEKNRFARELNRAKKYVVSDSPAKFDWKDSVLIQGNVVEEIERLKKQDGPELQVHGSGYLVQTLLKHDLIDEMWLKIHPITLGPGKRLFAEGTIPAAFTLTESSVSPKGVIIANYKRAGEVRAGSMK